MNNRIAELRNKISELEIERVKLQREIDNILTDEYKEQFENKFVKITTDGNFIKYGYITLVERVYDCIKIHFKGIAQDTPDQGGWNLYANIYSEIIRLNNIPGSITIIEKDEYYKMLDLYISNFNDFYRDCNE